MLSSFLLLILAVPCGDPGPLSEIAMPKDKIPPKWAAPFFIACASIMGLSLVIVLVFGERPPWYQVVVQAGMTVLCVWLARESSRKRSKAADAPEPQPE